ncbi:monocarboxylate transporter 4-like isoform X2 [Tubulanus polymorphus]|uniref:monocarboxylate transporter 4-like isoform X2 n=2 Tax=Tubulanus polymorphus TaxID=672921 RepID=UPI003DA42CE6
MICSKDEEEMNESETLRLNCNEEEPDDEKTGAAVNKTAAAAAPDGGWGWFCVLGCAFMHAFVVGNDRCFGLIYLKLEERFGQSSAMTAWVGGVAISLRMGLGPVTSILSNRFNYRLVVMFGSCLLFLGVTLSSLVPSLSYLYLTWGVILGTGGAMVYTPSFIVLGDYFNDRRAVANGLSSAGSGLGSFVLPQICRLLLEYYNYRGTLLIMGAVIFNVINCGALYRPLKRSKVKVVCIDYGLLRNIEFVLYAVFIGICTMSYMSIPTFIPALAVQKSIDWTQTAYFLSAYGVTNMIGRLVSGFIFDCSKIRPIRRYIYNITPFLLFITMIMFPLATGFTGFILCSLCYGLSNGLFVSQIASILADIVGADRFSGSIGIVTFFRGFGVMVAPVVGGHIKDVTGSYDYLFYMNGGLAVLSGIIFVIANIYHYRHQSSS